MTRDTSLVIWRASAKHHAGWPRHLYVSICIYQPHVLANEFDRATRKKNARVALSTRALTTGTDRRQGRRPPRQLSCGLRRTRSPTEESPCCRRAMLAALTSRTSSLFQLTELAKPCQSKCRDGPMMPVFSHQFFDQRLDWTVQIIEPGQRPESDPRHGPTCEQRQ